MSVQNRASRGRQEPSGTPSVFPSPFMDAASAYLPTNLTEMFDIAEYAWLTYGPFREAVKRAVAYFMTKVRLDGGADKEQQAAEALLDSIGLLRIVKTMGLNYCVYGTSFLSVHIPFIRSLRCGKCRVEYVAQFYDYQLKSGASGPEFHSRCARCDYSGRFDRVDRHDPDVTKLRPIYWNPRRIHVRPHPVTGEREIYWNIDPLLVREIKAGTRFYVTSMPWSMIEACYQRDPWYRFNEDEIYVMSEPALAGLDIHAWGIPMILSNVKTLFYIQLLRKYDEALAMDFVVPFRILHPKGGAEGAGIDALQMIGGEQFVAQMQSMIARRRADPTTVQVSPVAVGYQMLGGEAKSLAPKENLQYAGDEFLNGCGFPAQLFQGNLEYDARPGALRVFEQTWSVLPEQNNRLVDWFVKKVCRRYGYGPMTGAMEPVTQADDLERRMLISQGAAAGDISKGTAYHALGFDFLSEQEKVVSEQREIDRLRQEAEEEMQAAQSAGQAPMQGPGGAPMPPATTPGDLTLQAQDLAQQLVTQVPENMRRGELAKIRGANPTLHALVLQKMDELRRDMARQGQAMMTQQMQAAGQPKMAGHSVDLMHLGHELVEEAAAARADTWYMRKLAYASSDPLVRRAFHVVYRMR